MAGDKSETEDGDLFGDREQSEVYSPEIFRVESSCVSWVKLGSIKKEYSQKLI